MDDIRLEMETHYFGTLNVTRAFVPVIEANGGGIDPQRAVSALLGAHPGVGRVFRGQDSGLGDDGCCP
jgi:hypothetical protein